VADFIGDANLVDGEIVAERDLTTVVRLGTLEVRIAPPHAGLGPVKLAVRPDAVTIHQARPSEPAVIARIARSSYLGRHVEYRLMTPFGELFVVDRSRYALEPGTDIWISFSTNDVAIVRDQAKSPAGPA